MSQQGYADVKSILRAVAGQARPVTRKAVSQVVAESLRIATPGGFEGPWDPETFPYFVEPLDMTSSRNVAAVIVCGPAQCGKTFTMIGGRIAYTVVHDPADQLLIQMSQDTARDWSRKEFDRWVRNSPALQAKCSTSPRDDNIHDKFWADGSILKIGWPSVTQLASKSVRDFLATDIDRMPTDIGGEGDLFGLGMKRLTAWLSRGIGIGESSPGRDIPKEHAQWTRPAGTHMAPPVDGILGLFNQGDRRLWHWQCVICREWFEAEPGMGLFQMPEIGEIVELLRSYSVSQLVARYSTIVCPCCEKSIEQVHKRSMNIKGRWLVEGESINSEGVIRGEPVRSSWATYWLGGVAAAFQPWTSLVENYLIGIKNWSETGSETKLRQTTNTDQSMPYRPMDAGQEPQSAELLKNAAEGWQRETVPEDVRFVIVVADTQSNRFVCQAFGFGPGPVIEGEHRLDWWLIDRYTLRMSKRNGAALNPPAYLEDWAVLTERLEVGYPLADGSGRNMFPRILGVDSGGKAGATDNAYNYWRGVNAKGFGNRIRLVKGEGKPNAPRAELRKPDQRGRSDRNSSAAGDIPILFCGSRILKDSLSGQLERMASGDGGAHIGQGFGPEVFEELTAEHRSADGEWICPKGVRNEAADLAVYAIGLATSLGAKDPAFWRVPPSWAAPHDSNTLVYAPDAPPTPPKSRPLARAGSKYLRR